MSEIAQTEDIHSRIARAQTRPGVTQVLERMQPDIARTLPKGLDPDRVSRLMLTEIRKSEVAKQTGRASTSLAECTPESFVGATLTALALGLEPGINGECYLVPYRDRKSRLVECQLIIGYQGKKTMFERFDPGAKIRCEVVYEGDEFIVPTTIDEHLHWRAAAPDRRGDVVCYFAEVLMSPRFGSRYQYKVLYPGEVKELRRGKVGPSGDIPDPQRWMEKKVVLTQLLKLLPRSTAIAFSDQVDEQSGTRLSVQQMPARIMESAGEIEAAEAEGADQVVAPEELVSTGPADIPQPEQPSSPDRDVPDNVDPVTGEVLDEEPEPAPVPPPPPPPPPAPEPVRPPAEQVSRSRAKAAAPGKMNIGQRSALTGHWARLQMMDDPAERALVCDQILGLEPGTIKSAGELLEAQAARVLEVLGSVGSRDELDLLLAGQELLPGGES